MKEEVKERNSQFELLRIVAMLLIIFYHYTLHTGVMYSGSLLNRTIASFFAVGGKLGVNLFVFISGYYLIKVNTKKLLKLIFEIIFCSSILTIITQKEFDMEEIINCFFSISQSMYWFASSYILLYIFSPFINKFIKNLSINEYRKLLILILIFITIIPTIGNNYLSNIFAMGNNIVIFIYLYMIGAYIRITEKTLKQERKNLIILFILTYIAMFLLTYIMELSNKDFTKIAQPNTILMIICSVSLFMYFKDMKIKSSVINKIAQTTFGIYLIHDHPNRSVIWKNIFKSHWFFQSNIMILHMIFSCISIFYVCSIIDYIRINVIEKNVFKIKKIDNLCQKIDNYLKLEENHGENKNYKCTEI